MSPDWLAPVAAGAAFLCLFQASGTALYVLLFRGLLRDSESATRRLAISAGVLGVLLVPLQRCVEAARLSGTIGDLADAGLERLAWSGGAGLGALLQILSLAVVALALRRASTARARAAAACAVLACCAYLLTGHTSVHAQRVLLAPVLAVHLLLVAFWFGALLPLRLAIRLESPAAAQALLRGFSALALWWVPCIGVAGLSMSLTLMPHAADWRTTYGALILVKVAGFFALLALAAWNRWRLVPEFPDGAARIALHRSILIEYVLMIAVLATTAQLISFYSP